MRVTRIKKGRYSIQNGNHWFNVLKMENGRWVYEHTGTGRLDEAATLAAVKADIRNGWTPTARGESWNDKPHLQWRAGK